MNSTLQLIAIQHELGMSIGLDLRLEPMLLHFTRVCIRRLGLAGVHYFLSRDALSRLATGEAGDEDGLSHYLSVPGSGPEGILSNPACSRLIREHDARAGDSGGIHALCNGHGYLYACDLPGVGMVILHRAHRPMDESIQQLLKPVLARLATSCRASIEHEQLVHIIDAHKKAKETILFQLKHDELTGLPNRRLLRERLTQELSRCRRHGRYGALLFMDLDRFKAVNDTLGHAVGDRLLVAFASQLSSALRCEDMVARFGGDEFVILLSDLGSSREQAENSAEAVIDKLYALFSRPLHDGEHTFHVGCCIGVDIFPDGNRAADDIIRHADTAMYQAKSGGRNNAVFYDGVMSDEIRSRMELEKELKIAVRDGGFELYYQPQFHSSRGLVGAEVLLRWNSPKHGFVSPARFIPIAEESGLILDIGNWVLQSACGHIRLLEASGLPPSFRRISVNVSAVQMEQPDFVETVVDALRSTAVSPGLLGLELTEGSLIEHVDDTVRKMRILVHHGVHFSIDDFGTGYSSLSYLNNFPVDTLKLDQSFVRGMDRDRGNQSIVETIMSLARSLGLAVIAEGVETLQELECLERYGCEQFQGYYFGKPMPFADFLDMLRDENPRKSAGLE